MDFKTIGEAVINKARKYGAHEAEAYFENSRQFQVAMRKGEVETLRKTESNGLNLRVFIDRRLGTASTSDLTEASLDDIIKRTVELAGLTASKPWNGLPDIEPGQPKDLDLYDGEIAAVPDETKMNMVRDMEKTALALDKRITNSSGGFTNTEKTVGIFNSKGMANVYRETSFSCNVSVIAGERDAMQSAGWASSKRFFKELASPGAIAQTAVEKAVAKLGPRPVPTGKFPVIFDRYAANRFWQGLTIAMSGDSAFRKMNFLCDSLDKSIASPLITLVDDPTIPRFIGSVPFDGEGCLTGRELVIEKGILRKFFHDSISARKAGVKTRTTAKRYEFSGPAFAGPLCLIAENGKSPFKSLFNGITKGLYITGLRGIGVDGTTGSYSTGGNGFWIENGSIAFPVDGVTLGGSTLEILNGIDMVADDLDMRGTINSPSFRVASITVGGR